ncbi:MAG: T9SS type A sorting domain-containing protein [Cytophagales bacterium]|nr:T9SS type A sorting domain-containing protein [Cytophagales bacterium]
MNYNRIILTTLLLGLLLINNGSIFSQVIGNAFLSGQTDHSGTKVKFIPNSQTAQLDSTYTNFNGNYTINLNGGLYKVLFSKSAYQSLYYNSGNIFVIATNDTLNDVTLQPGSVIFVTGPISGIWENTNYYIVSGDININSGSSLEIEEGTNIKFNGNYTFTVDGKLTAIGTEVDPIIFTSNILSPNEGDWNQLDINNSQTVIDHCIIEYCKTCINSSDYSPTISNNEIRYFSDDGIYSLKGSPLITNNVIHDYYSNPYARGIWIQSTSNAIVDCNTVYNGLGYGIYSSSTILIKNNIIYNITGSDRGYGIDVRHAISTINNNHIYFCRIGINIGRSGDNNMPNPFITNNTIRNNSHAGISFDQFYGNGTVINNIIVNNNIGIEQGLPGCSFCSNTPDEISYNLVWNNTNGNYVDVQIIGIGQIVTTNSNADNIDSYFNLSQDPLFANNTPPNLETNSPCLNAGNSNYSSNIGFSSSFVCEQIILDSNFNLVEEYIIINQNYPNPFKNLTIINYSILKDTKLKIEIIDIKGQIIKVPVNEYKISGEYTLRLDVTGMNSGIYFFKLSSNNYTLTKKMIVKI